MRLKAFFTENIHLKVLSLFLALVLWLLVFNISKPEITDERSVRVEVINQDIFDKENLVWQIDKASVAVRYNVRSDIRNTVSSQDFRCYVDLQDYYSVTGTCPVYVEILNEKDRVIDDIQVNPSIVHIQIENIEEKKFDVKLNVTGNTRSGYTIANQIISPESVYLRGTESELGRISSVGIDVSCEDISENMEGSGKLEYFDAMGNTVDLNGVKSSEDVINYAFTIHKEKEINLTCSVEGVQESGYQYESMTVSPESVKLSASPQVIEGMSVFELPSVNINNATGDVTVSYDIKNYLPAGVELSDEADETCTVTVRINKIPENEVVLRPPFEIIGDLHENGNSSLEGDITSSDDSEEAKNPEQKESGNKELSENKAAENKETPDDGSSDEGENTVNPSDSENKESITDSSENKEQ